MKNVALLAAFAALTSGQAIKGFNYGSDTDFQTAFTTAQNLAGAPGFTSARLYTMIEPNTADTPTSAIPAAIDTKTTLLLGMWASAGQATISNEITALTSAISQYGSSFTNLVKGISVGSEDLYRISPTGIENESGVGAEPSDIVNYINQVRSALSGAGVSGIPVGHVDTWTAWVNGSNDAVISACDFLGMDAYPYFQNTMANDISNGYSLFNSAYEATVGNSQGKPVWVTETGWPVSGATENQAVPSVQNAQTYWDQVGCGMLFDKIDTWWYQLAGDAFGVSSSVSDTTPIYNLTCPSGSTGGDSSSSSSSPQPSTSAAKPSQPASSASGGGSGVIATPTPGPSEVAPSAGPSGTGSSGSSGSGSGSGNGSGSGSSGVVTGHSSGNGTATLSTTGSPSRSATSVASQVSAAGAARNFKILW